MRQSHRWWEVWLRALLASWRVAVLLTGSVAVIALTSHFYLLPAMESWQQSTHDQRAHIRLISLLLLVVMLSMLAIGVLWAARRR